MIVTPEKKDGCRQRTDWRAYDTHRLRYFAGRVSDQQIMDELLKIKRMVADLEANLKAKEMPNDATRREKIMPMLNEIERLLKDVRAYGS